MADKLDRPHSYAYALRRLAKNAEGEIQELINLDESGQLTEEVSTALGDVRNAYDQFSESAEHLYALIIGKAERNNNS